MRIMFVGLSAMAALVGAAWAEPRPTTPEDLLGAWEMVSIEIDTAGNITKPFGEKPSGMLIQTPTHALLTFTGENRPAPAAIALTDQEAAQLMRSMVTWGATYKHDPNPTPDGTKFTYHLTVAANPALMGAERVFYDMIDGDTLYVISKSQPNVQDGTVSITRVVWRKLD